MVLLFVGVLPLLILPLFALPLPLPLLLRFTLVQRILAPIDSKGVVKFNR